MFSGRHLTLTLFDFFILGDWLLLGRPRWSRHSGLGAAPFSHSVAFSFGRDHGGVLTEAVEQCEGELLVASEDLGPF